MSLSTANANNNGNNNGGVVQRPLHVCITGTSQGIGLVAARTLIGQGHVVYHACRNMERAQHAVQESGGGIPMVCDLSDLDSVQQFAKHFEQSAQRLDVLCLNAGVAPYSGAEQPRLTKQGYEECIGVNHIGHFLLANLLYPKLKADGGGRLIVTASSVHDPNGPGGKSQGGNSATLGDMSGLGVNLKIHPSGATMIDGTIQYNGGKVYKDSKLCNVLFCREAIHRFNLNENDPAYIAVYCFTPGFIPTTGLFQPLRDQSWFKAQVLTTFARIAGFAMTEQIGGDRLSYMITSPEIVQKLPNGSYVCPPTSKSTATTIKDGFTTTNVSEEASNAQLGQALWDKSLEIVKAWMK